MTLLQTKFTMPTARPALVFRDRLFQRLDAMRDNKLILVSAPAGFGKTTLLAAYGAQAVSAGDATFAWLTLEEEDNDPVRFLTYFLAALANTGIVLPVDETAVSVTSPDLLMTAVVNSLTAVYAAQPTHHHILVLDDYHLIHNQIIHETIAFLLEHMPPQMHLLLATRADPPLSLARWRAYSQLIELRQQDLRFTTEEAADFLNQIMNLSLSNTDVQTLNKHTEGWIAGLQMAAISLQGRSDVPDFVRNFSGSHRYVLDYLMEEVLSRQPESITQFLLQTSILDRFTAPLCDAVMGLDERIIEPPAAGQQSPSQYILNQLETANLFIIPLDQERRWYRYHRLFIDLLQQRLAQAGSVQISDLHRRAAAWFEANSYTEEAIIHALSAGMTAKAADLIAQLAETMLMRSEMVTLMRWLIALPEAELVKRPSLCFYYAWILIMEGQAQAQTKVEKALQQVEAEGAPGELALVHSLLALLQADGAAGITLAQEALARLAPNHLFLRGTATWILGLAYLLHGELEQGIQTLEEAVQFSQQIGNMSIAAVSMGRLANLAWRRGNLPRAKRLYEQAMLLATDEEERPLPIAGEVHLGLARLYFEWNELETALQHVETGLALMERWREISAMAGYLWMARIRQAQGDSEAANKALEHARYLARQSEGTQLDDLAVAISEASLRLLQNDIEAVARWCARRHIPQEVDTTTLRQRDDIVEGHLRKYEFTILARLRLAQHRPDDALRLLYPLLTNAQYLQRCDLQIEIHILIALAYELKEEVTQADHHLQKAIILGKPGGFVRLFVEAGPGIASLLARQPPDEEWPVYLHTLQAACSHRQPLPSSTPVPHQPLIEPLSQRELEVLSLIARGLSNREIATELVLSLSTIKWHTSNLYGKLGVSNRTMAVARARELQILPTS